MYVRACVAIFCVDYDGIKITCIRRHVIEVSQSYQR